MKHETDIIGKYSASLSLIEVGLGALLHGFKIPFSGQFLSLNQHLILTLASKEEPRSRIRGTKISLIASLLKTLSPAGKKLTPMLAILCQGILHSIGLIILGPNIFGFLLGGILLSLWAFIQPVMIYFVLFGNDIFYMIQYFLKKMNKVFIVTEQDLLTVLATIILIKVSLSIVVTIFAMKMNEDFLEKYLGKISNISKRTKPKSRKDLTPVKGVLKDITSPLFVLSFIFMGVFYFYSSHNLTTFIWRILRPLAVAIILFYIIRVIPLESVSSSQFLSKYPNIQESFRKSLQKLKEF
ncbi:MAG: hypothetical protein GY909_09965 [Oligoflexia bacterium]|nr:hypothetical protein [Oligoflexia bacterium]